MDNLIRINNHDIQAKEFKGQRIVTFKDIDMVHERPEGTAKRNFTENRERFIENVDYFIARPSDFGKYENRTLEIPNRGLTLITESGYLMLVKSFTDDLAWKVQRELVNSYFREERLTRALTKESKAGGLNGLLKTLNSVMKEENIPSWQRAEVIKDVAEQCGVKIPDSFIKKPAFMQISLLLPLNEQPEGM